MIELPVKPTAGVEQLNKLLIFSQPKTGKTSALSQLPNSLIIDMEDGANQFDGTKLSVKDLCVKEGKHPVAIIKMIAKSIDKKNKEEGRKIYDYIVLDTTTEMEALATVYATVLYKQSAIGKNAQVNDVVSELEYGAGYTWLRNAFKELYMPFEGLANKCLILSGHAKDSSIKKDGKSLSARDIALTGKLKLMISGRMDATAYMYRKEGTTENYLSFKNEEFDLVTGSRVERLSGNEYLISEKKDGKIVTHWDIIFND